MTPAITFRTALRRCSSVYVCVVVRGVVETVETTRAAVRRSSLVDVMPDGEQDGSSWIGEDDSRTCWILGDDGELEIRG